MLARKNLTVTNLYEEIKKMKKHKLLYGVHIHS